MEEEEKKPRGGARESAGRKPLGGVGGQHITLRVRKDYLMLIDTYFKSRSKFINEAIRAKLRREGLI
jgi:hypothetical protein